jgi:hypothetical protein
VRELVDYYFAPEVRRGETVSIASDTCAFELFAALVRMGRPAYREMEPSECFGAQVKWHFLLPGIPPAGQRSSEGAARRSQRCGSSRCGRCSVRCSESNCAALALGRRGANSGAAARVS